MAILVLAVLSVAIAGVLGWHALMARIDAGSLSCLPSDFPSYPGATWDGQNYDLNANATPGSFCQMSFRSPDSAGSVQSFYLSRLNSGTWEVTSGTGTLIEFESVGNHRKHGTVGVTTTGGHTEIKVEYYSP